MADNKEYFTLPGDKGNINISEDVIATVAANAAPPCRTLSSPLSRALPARR